MSSFARFRGVGGVVTRRAGGNERRVAKQGGRLHAVQNVAPSRRQDAEDKDEDEDNDDEDESGVSVGTSARADQYNR